jgi:hypothetical protein
MRVDRVVVEQISPAYIRMCDDSLPNHVLAAVIAAIRQVIENDRFPHARRLDPLRAALARLGRGEANRGDEGARGPAQGREISRASASEPASPPAPNSLRILSRLTV